MATLSAGSTKVPQAHRGLHYANQYSKPVRGSLSAADRDKMQRLTWQLFFILVLGVFVMAVVLSMVD